MLINKKIVAIIEARVGSTRFPGKVLMPLAGKPALLCLVERITPSIYINEIIIATTTSEKDNKIIDFCDKNEINSFRGSENNVLNRIYLAALFFKADVVVSITADCPCLDYRHIDSMIEGLKNYDCITNYKKREWPDGLDLSIFTIKSLIKIEKIIPKDDVIREHGGYNIVSRDDIFNVKHLSPLDELMNWPTLRITLDTKTDYDLLNKCFVHFKKTPLFTAEELIEYIKINSKKLLIYTNLNK